MSPARPWSALTAAERREKVRPLLAEGHAASIIAFRLGAKQSQIATIAAAIRKEERVAAAQAGLADEAPAPAAEVATITWAQMQEPERRDALQAMLERGFGLDDVAVRYRCTGDEVRTTLALTFSRAAPTDAEIDSLLAASEPTAAETAAEPIVETAEPSRPSWASMSTAEREAAVKTGLDAGLTVRDIARNFRVRNGLVGGVAQAMRAAGKLQERRDQPAIEKPLTWRRRTAEQKDAAIVEGRKAGLSVGAIAAQLGASSETIKGYITGMRKRGIDVPAPAYVPKPEVARAAKERSSRMSSHGASGAPTASVAAYDAAAYPGANASAPGSLSPVEATETRGGTGDDCSVGKRGAWPPPGGASSSRGLNDTIPERVVTGGESAAAKPGKSLPARRGKCLSAPAEPVIAITAAAAFDPLPGVEPVALLDIASGQCRWPLDTGPFPGALMCGGPTQPGSNLCRHHHALAWRPPASRAAAKSANPTTLKTADASARWLNA